MDGSEINALGNKLANGREWCYGKGGFWVEGDRFYTLAEARRITGIQPANKRNPAQHIGAYGDWAWVAAINHIKS